MDLNRRVAAITGAGAGIGRGLAERFHREGAIVVVSDKDLAAAEEVAHPLDAVAIPCDVARPEHFDRLVNHTIDWYGRIDLFISNAGVTTSGGFDVSDDEWLWNWQINVMSHVNASRHVIPQMLRQGDGYFLTTASAAGLLTEVGSAPYSVTKHGTVAFTEWLAVNYQRKGIRCSCLCPAGVDTGFLDHSDPIHRFLHQTSVTVEQVADCVVEGIRDERFLILPHPEVGEFFAFKGQDYDRYLRNFSRLHDKIDRMNQRPRAA